MAEAALPAPSTRVLPGGTGGRWSGRTLAGMMDEIVHAPEVYKKLIGMQILNVERL